MEVAAIGISVTEEMAVEEGGMTGGTKVRVGAGVLKLLTSLLLLPSRVLMNIWPMELRRLATRTGMSDTVLLFGSMPPPGAPVPESLLREIERERGKGGTVRAAPAEAACDMTIGTASKKWLSAPVTEPARLRIGGRRSGESMCVDRAPERDVVRSRGEGVRIGRLCMGGVSAARGGGFALTVDMSPNMRTRESRRPVMGRGASTLFCGDGGCCTS